MARKELAVDSVAEAYLALIAERRRVEDPAALPAALERARPCGQGRKASGAAQRHLPGAVV